MSVNLISFVFEKRWRFIFNTNRLLASLDMESSFLHFTKWGVIYFLRNKSWACFLNPYTETTNQIEKEKEGIYLSRLKRVPIYLSGWKRVNLFIEWEDMKSIHILLRAE